MNGFQGLNVVGASQLLIVLEAESLKETREVEVPTEEQLAPVS